MKKSSMSPTVLRGLLGTAVVLSIGLAGVGFYFAHGWLAELAVSVSNKVAESSTSGSDLQALSRLQQEIASQQEVATKASSMFTSSQTFQTQAVKDLGIYAAATGITISNFTFGTPATTAVSTGISGLDSTITITLTSPVSYTSLLKFMQAIESNLPKMQISSVNLTRIEGDSQSVQIDQLTIGVYTR